MRLTRNRPKWSRTSLVQCLARLNEVGKWELPVFKRILLSDLVLMPYKSNTGFHGLGGHCYIGHFRWAVSLNTHSFPNWKFANIFVPRSHGKTIFSNYGNYLVWILAHQVLVLLAPSMVSAGGASLRSAFWKAYDFICRRMVSRSGNAETKPPRVIVNLVPQSDTLVILLGWAGCHDRYLKKYADYYEKAWFVDARLHFLL